MRRGLKGALLLVAANMQLALPHCLLFINFFTALFLFFCFGFLFCKQHLTWCMLQFICACCINLLILLLRPHARWSFAATIARLKNRFVSVSAYLILLFHAVAPKCQRICIGNLIKYKLKKRERVYAGCTTITTTTARKENNITIMQHKNRWKILCKHERSDKPTNSCHVFCPTHSTNQPISSLEPAVKWTSCHSVTRMYRLPIADC